MVYRLTSITWHPVITGSNTAAVCHRKQAQPSINTYLDLTTITQACSGVKLTPCHFEVNHAKIGHRLLKPTFTMQLTQEQVEHIAQLARLNLTDQEKITYQQELSSILDYVDKLQAVDTTNVQETSQVTGLQNVTRSDTVIDQGLNEQLLEQAPQAKHGYYVIPKIFDNK